MVYKVLYNIISNMLIQKQKLKQNQIEEIR